MAKTRSILVTGAAGGVGNALVQLLLARGDTVYASARRIDQMQALHSAGARLVAMDVGNTASAQAAFAEISRTANGKLDASVHCAAVAPLGSVEFTNPEEVAHVLNVNTLGALRVLQGALPLLREAEDGRLVLVSSLWGQVSGPFVSAYAASKHAIEALADSARRETGGRRVRISVVEPGVVSTPMLTNQSGEVQRKIAALSAAERALYLPQYEAYAKLLAKAEKSAITAAACAASIAACLDARRPKVRYRVGNDAKLMISLGAILPDRAMDRLFGLIIPAGERA